MRDVEDDVVGGWIRGILVEMIPHEANPLAVDFFQLAGGMSRVGNPRLLAKRRYPLFEWCDEPHFQNRLGRKNVSRSATNDDAIPLRGQFFDGLAQLAHERVLIHLVQHKERFQRFLDPTDVPFVQRFQFMDI